MILYSERNGATFLLQSYMGFYNKMIQHTWLRKKKFRRISSNRVMAFTTLQCYSNAIIVDYYLTISYVSIGCKCVTHDAWLMTHDVWCISILHVHTWHISITKLPHSFHQTVSWCKCEPEYRLRNESGSKPHNCTGFNNPIFFHLLKHDVWCTILLYVHTWHISVTKSPHSYHQTVTWCITVQCDTVKHSTVQYAVTMLPQLSITNLHHRTKMNCSRPEVCRCFQSRK